MISYILEEGGRTLGERGKIPHLGKQIMKVLGSKGVGVEEFLDDISKLKRKYSYAPP